MGEPVTVLGPVVRIGCLSGLITWFYLFGRIT